LYQGVVQTHRGITNQLTMALLVEAIGARLTPPEMAAAAPQDCVICPVLIFLAELSLTVLLFLAELVLTALIFLAELVLSVLLFLAELVLTVLEHPYWSIRTE
jgi:hypothetical protein